MKSLPWKNFLFNTTRKRVGKGALFGAVRDSTHGALSRLHSEGRIVYTIFGLLFWEIIFAPVPGAFETPFQVASLDIDTDTFYHSRRELFEKRLDEIKQGKAREIIGNIDLKHRDEQTLCAGVRWDLIEREDLENIVEVRCSTLYFRFTPNKLNMQYFGGEQLCEISRIISEEYRTRGGGLPDLFLWHDEQKCCKFVEVKGPGDKLSESQKVREMSMRPPLERH